MTSAAFGSDTDALTHLVIVGSGWAGYTLSAELDYSKYKVTVISPDPITTYTPLLASALCGLFGFKVAEEPVRRRSRPVSLYQAVVDNVDFSSKTVDCTSRINSFEPERISISYDQIVLCQGCKGNDFGIPGVGEHSYAVRNTKDATALRNKISDVLEKANLPTTRPQRRRELLHFAIVGGGPTGVELAAELFDTMHQDIAKLFPHLEEYFNIAIYDVASNILSNFEEDLSTYALESFRRRGVAVHTNTHITEVRDGSMTTKEKGEIKFGVLIWATGNANVPLTEKLNCRKTKEGLVRLLTDDHLRLYYTNGRVIKDAFAIGDAADIESRSLPTTAEVAVQKAKWLAKNLSSYGEGTPFKFHEKRMVAYLGASAGVWQNDKVKLRGRLAWLSWRSTSLSWTHDWRKKILILVHWTLNYFYGKEIARI